MRTRYVPDVKIEAGHMRALYDVSRSKYSRSLEAAKRSAVEEQKDVLTKIESFSEPIL